MRFEQLRIPTTPSDSAATRRLMLDAYEAGFAEGVEEGKARIQEAIREALGIPLNNYR